MGIDGDRRTVESVKNPSTVQSEDYMDWTGAYVHTPEPGIHKNIMVVQTLFYLLLFVSDMNINKIFNFLNIYL